jgi:hypothetical protein
VAKRMVLLDFRLVGMVSSDVGEVLQVSVRTPIKEAFDKVAARARQLGGLDDLLICCHGLAIDGAHEDAAMSLRTSGGLGLQLCAENLSFRTIDVVGVLQGTPPLVNRIVVFSCSAAATNAALKNQRGDGMRLMGEIALRTGARVVAATEDQDYLIIPSMVQFLFRTGAQNDRRIDFGEWEGAVYEFSPDDGVGRKLKPERHPHFDF